MASIVYEKLGKYLLGNELTDKLSYPLYNIAKDDNIDLFRDMISNGYNPYRRPENVSNYSFENCSDKYKSIFLLASSDWIEKLYQGNNNVEVFDIQKIESCNENVKSLIVKGYKVINTFSLFPENTIRFKKQGIELLLKAVQELKDNGLMYQADMLQENISKI